MAQGIKLTYEQVINELAKSIKKDGTIIQTTRLMTAAHAVALSHGISDAKAVVDLVDAVKRKD